MPEQYLPKSEWGPGPWQDEPDSYSWRHAGLQCHIYRNSSVSGSLNGYVAVAADHPWWGKSYNECVATPTCEQDAPTDWEAMAKEGFPVPSAGSAMREFMSEPRWSCAHRIESLLEVHGGVTYAGPMTCIVDQHEEAFHWGFGFDTSHAGDVSPAMDATLRQIYLGQKNGAAEWAEHERIMRTGPFGDTYKTFGYVKEQTERLAEQLAIAQGLGWQALREPMGDTDADAGNDAPGAHAHPEIARRLRVRTSHEALQPGSLGGGRRAPAVGTYAARRQRAG